MTDQDSEVKRIARDGSFTLPPEARDGRELVMLAQRLAGLPDGSEQWYAALDAAPTPSIINSMGALGTFEPRTGPRLHAFRDAARAMVEKKLADRMIAKMDRLEKASNRLAGAGILLAAFIAGFELWVRS